MLFRKLRCLRSLLFKNPVFGLVCKDEGSAWDGAGDYCGEFTELFLDTYEGLAVKVSPQFLAVEQSSQGFRELAPNSRIPWPAGATSWFSLRDIGLAPHQPEIVPNKIRATFERLVAAPPQQVIN